MRRRPPTVRGFYTMDNYASAALDMRPPIGSSLADAQIHNAKETFSYRVLPDIDEDSLVVSCSDAQVAEFVRETLFDWSSRHDLWDQPNMSMELRSWVTGMITFRDVYIHFEFDRVDDSDPWKLIFVGWLPPETVVVKGRGAKRRYEQFVSRHWPEGAPVSVIGGAREFLEVFSADEVIHLQWPLDERHGRGPEYAARRAGRPVDRYGDRLLAAARSGAEPDETFLPIAKGRAGAYTGALDHEKLHDAVVGDRLFLPPEEDVTEYFYVDRLVRSRIAACEVRNYLLDAIGEQLLGPWSALNGWPTVRLELRRECWTIEDWRTLHAEYQRGQATIDDVLAAEKVEWEPIESRRRRLG